MAATSIRMRHEVFAERMRALQADVREDLGGRVVPVEEIVAQVRAVLTEQASRLTPQAEHE